MYNSTCQSIDQSAKSSRNFGVSTRNGLMHDFRRWELLRWSVRRAGAESPVRHFSPVPHGAERVQRGTDVQDGKFTALWIHLPGVVVINDVSHIPSASIDDPIVPVKRQLIAHPWADSRARREILRFSAEFFQPRVGALRSMQRLPFQNFLPGYFVVDIVNADYVGHVIAGDI